MDILINSSYGDPRLRMKGNPYQRYPERSYWTEWEIWQRPDGTTYRKERECCRWGGEISKGPWKLIP
jgi:hypothetical protein